MKRVIEKSCVFFGNNGYSHVIQYTFSNDELLISLIQKQSVYNVFTLHSNQKMCTHCILASVLSVFYNVCIQACDYSEYMCVNTVCSQCIQCAHHVFRHVYTVLKD